MGSNVKHKINRIRQTTLIILFVGLFSSVAKAQIKPVQVNHNLYGQVHISVPLALNHQSIFPSFRWKSGDFIATVTEYRDGRDVYSPQPVVVDYDLTLSLIKRTEKIKNLEIYPSTNSNLRRTNWLPRNSPTLKLIKRLEFFESGPICSNGGYYEKRIYEDWTFNRDSSLNKVVTGQWDKGETRKYTPQIKHTYSYHKNRVTATVSRFHSETKKLYFDHKVVRIYNKNHQIQLEANTINKKQRFQDQDITSIAKHFDQNRNGELSAGALDTLLYNQWGILEVISYKYAKNKLVQVNTFAERIYYDHNNSITISYNSDGLINEVKELDIESNWTTSFTFNYNSKGLLAKKTYTSKWNDDKAIITTETFTYYNNGLLESVNNGYNDTIIFSIKDYRVK